VPLSLSPGEIEYDEAAIKPAEIIKEINALGFVAKPASTDSGPVSASVPFSFLVCFSVPAFLFVFFFSSLSAHSSCPRSFPSLVGFGGFSFGPRLLFLEGRYQDNVCQSFGRP
jgi:hypothetical protein